MYESTTYTLKYPMQSNIIQDLFLNCLMIGLMFKYNEKYYKKCCRCCILLCFIKCDKSRSRPKRREIMTYIDSWNEEIDISKLFKMADFDSQGADSPKSPASMEHKYDDEDIPSPDDNNKYPKFNGREMRIASIADMISDVAVDENMDLNEVKLSPLSKPQPNGGISRTVSRINLKNTVSEDMYMIGSEYKSPELTTNHTATHTHCDLNQTPSFIHTATPRQITIFESDKLDLNVTSSTQTQHISAEIDGDMEVVKHIAHTQTQTDNELVMVKMVPLDKKLISAATTEGIATPTITTPTMTGITPTATITGAGEFSMDVNAPRSRSGTYKRHLSPANTPIVNAQNSIQNGRAKGKIKIFRLRKF